MTRCFILSNGTQDRFRSFAPKQLLEFGDETIMSRQLRQLDKLGITPIVVSGNSLILEKHTVTASPGPTQSILHTVIATEGEWTEARILFVLGDVMFSTRTLAEFVHDTRPIRFCMSGSEIYGLSFQRDAIPVIESGLDYCARHSDSCRMWHLYRYLRGVDIHRHSEIHPSDMSGELVGCNCAFDVDSLEQYQELKKTYIGLA